MAVSINQLRNRLKSLESKRDFLIENRRFDELNPILDAIKNVQDELALNDPDSEYAKKLRFEKMQKIFKKN